MFRRSFVFSLAGRMIGQVVNAQNIARDASVARITVDNYFGALTDTLVAHILPAWRPGLKVREAAQPKFYWFDPGVARASAGLLRDPPDRLWQGTALETMVYREFRVYNDVSRKQRPLYYNRTPAGVEVDFIVEPAQRRPRSNPSVVVIEVKRSERWDRVWEKPMRSLSDSAGVTVERMFGVYCGSRRYQFDDVGVMPVSDFIKALFAGGVF